MLGLVRDDGTRMVIAEVPVLLNVKLFGLSALCTPTGVVAKVKAGVVATFTLRIRLLSSSEM